jgi:hypothetical protein
MILINVEKIGSGLLTVIWLLLLSACIPEPVAQPTLPTSDLIQSLSPTHSLTISPLLESTPLPSMPELPITGLEFHSMADLDPIYDVGAFWLRRNGLIWHDVEPEEGMRNWEALEKLEIELITASERGQEVILIVRGTPTWAQSIPGYYCGPILPEKLSAFSAFMEEAVARYSLPPYNVRYWELGNEPDVAPELIDPGKPFGCWGDMQDEYYGGKYYAEMLKKVYPIIKATNPQAQVLIGGLLLDCDPLNPPEITSGSSEFRDCTPSRFLEGIFLNGGGDYFDGVSFHGYDYFLGPLGQYFNPGWHSSWDTTGPVIAAKVHYLRGLLDHYGYGDKYLMNTETALICGSTGREPPCVSDEYELTKAYYLIQSYADALANNLKANIWYSLRGWRGSGLIRNDEITPAYYAYQFAVEKLEGVAFIRMIRDYPNVIGFEFLNDGKLTWILWALDEESHWVDLPEPPLAIYNVFGDSLEIGKEILITVAPVFIDLPSE